MSNFSIYFFASVINSILSFFLLPVIAQLLAIEVVGRLELLFSTYNILINLALFGMPVYFYKNYHSLTKEEQCSKYKTINIFLLLTSTFFIILYFIINLFVKGDLHFDLKSVLLIGLIVYFNVIKQFYLTYLQLISAAVKYSIITTIESIFEWGITIYVLKFITDSYYVRPAVFALIGFLFCIYIFFNLKKTFILSAKVNSNDFMGLLKFGLPFVFSSIASWTMEMIDKFFVTGYLGIEQNAIYSIGYKFGMIIMMIEISFSKAWAPYFYSNIEKKPKTVLKNITLLTLLFLFGIIIFIPIAKLLLVHMYPNSYFGAVIIISIISFAYFFDHLWKVTSLFLIQRNRTILYNISIVFGGFVNVILDIVLIPRFALSGAAWATLLSFVAGFFVSISILLIDCWKNHGKKSI